ncbi:hypothetical protein ANCCAN_12479 [Ancylostoma caninum]|uniref:IPO4/5-like TPR repeats domain-containing protein n=1 Tax=Ancylostoma caninum TaxID=29170 RepID=A0A368GFH6_ANCCA|nr:hypothetical protein ANCCAN_12479 [Ancylostoma caninum]
MDLNQFNELITRMQSSDNEQRTQAETIYHEIEIRTLTLLLYSLYVQQDATPEITRFRWSVLGNNVILAFQNRLMSLVLLRRLIQNQWDEFKEGLGDNLEIFLDQILRGFNDESDNGFRKKMLMVIAEMARNTIDEDTGKQKWLGVIGLLNHCMSSKKAEDLICVASILEAVPNVFGSDYDQYMHDVKRGNSYQCMTIAKQPYNIVIGNVCLPKCSTR